MKFEKYVSSWIRNPIIDQTYFPLPYASDSGRPVTADGNFAGFISSILSLKAERDIVAEVVKSFNCNVIRWEGFVGQAQGFSSQTAYLAGVRQSDFFVLLFTPQYGSPGPNGISGTHEEFQEALRLGRYCICLVDSSVNKSNLSTAHREFLDEVEKERVYKRFDSEEELRSGLKDAIASYLEYISKAWIRVDNLILPAQPEYDNESVSIIFETNDSRIIQHVHTWESQLPKSVIYSSIQKGEALAAILSRIRIKELSASRATISFDLSLKARTKKSKDWKVLKVSKVKEVEGGFFDLDFDRPFISGREGVEQSVRLHIRSRKGEMIGNSSFGSNLHFICEHYHSERAIFELLTRFEIIDSLTCEEGNTPYEAIQSVSGIGIRLFEIAVNKLELELKIYLVEDEQPLIIKDNILWPLNEV